MAEEEKMELCANKNCWRPATRTKNGLPFCSSDCSREYWERYQKEQKKYAEEADDY